MTQLKQAGVPNGRTDALILLADLFQTDKSWIHSHPEVQLDNLQVRELDYKLGKRLNHLPLAYIRGFSEFYGRKFTVNSNVLIPRPESEAMITMLLKMELEMPLIADIGTGSGCLGITAALEMPDATVRLYDISDDALAIAQHNALQYGLTINCVESDLLASLGSERYDALLVNLPYVPDGLITSPEIKTEPGLALFSGDDGLDLYRRFWEQVAAAPLQPLHIFTEALTDQQEAVTDLASKAGYKLIRTDILIQHFQCS
jgi:release factor glutamine methyltransferase